MAKSAQRLKARRLRRKGFSINEIAKNVGFSKRTISRWCNDIFLNVKQKQVLWLRAKVKYNLNFKNYCESRHEATQEKIQTLKQEGIKAIGDLSKRDLFIAGVALYWAEGFKKDSRAGFASMDPAMINFFIRWLKECFNYSNEDLKLVVTANISHKYRIHEIQSFWSKQTGIPIEDFNKPFYQKAKWVMKYENPEGYYGVLRIRVKKSIDLLRKMRGWIDGLGK